MEPTDKVRNPWDGAYVFVKERTRSTMDDVLDLAVKGYPVGTAVIAGFQDAGRGRAPGRRWISPPWQSLLFSVVLSRGDPGFPVSQLPLRAAVAVCRSLEDLLAVQLCIKWPNDVLVGEKKISGILCEGRRGFFTCGVGVNLAQESFPEELSASCSLRTAGGARIDAFSLCARVLCQLKRVLADHQMWKTELDARLYGRGRAVEVRAPGSDRTARGTIQGVHDDGALVLRGAEGALFRVSHGEISGNP